MDYLAIVIDAFKRVFRGENILIKHISLFALVGIMGVFSSQLQDISKHATQVFDIQSVLWLFLVVLVLGIYISGYQLLFIHDSFDSERTDYEIPDIDLKTIPKAISALPLYIVWLLYLIFMSFGAALTSAIIIGLVFMLILAFVIPFFPFVFIAYAEHFNAFGLYDITLPFRYCKLGLKSVIMFGLYFIPIYVVAMLPPLIVALVAGFLSGDFLNDTTKISFSLVYAYTAMLVQLLWAYCCVQIYKEKIQPNI